MKPETARCLEERLIEARRLVREVLDAVDRHCENAVDRHCETAVKELHEMINACNRASAAIDRAAQRSLNRR